MDTDIILKKADLSDLPDILEMEHLCFGEDSFSKTQFIYLMKLAKGVFYVVRDGGKAIAYLSLLYHGGSHNLRVYSIAVHPDHRQKKLGQRLMDETIAYAGQCHASKITLEVRVSNTAAIRLYEKNGFVKAGIKPNYYHDGTDAYYMIHTTEE